MPWDLGLIVFAIPVGLLLLVITRVWLELLAVLFHIAHNTAPTPATPPSPQHQWSPASPAPVRMADFGDKVALIHSSAGTIRSFAQGHMS